MIDFTDRDEPDSNGSTWDFPRDDQDPANDPQPPKDGTPYSEYRKNSKPKIELLDGPAIAAPLPDLDYLVKEIGLVAGGGAPHLTAGYGFSGKTLAKQAMALALAAGRPVWGAYATTPRRVLHVDFEQGDRLTRHRYQRLARAMGIELGDLGDALAVAIMPPISFASEHIDRWIELMTGRDLVIIDSLRAATAGADENSSDIRAGLDRLGAASEKTECRASIIHHSRKPSEDDPGGRYSIRGSSAIYDAVDSAYVFGAAKGEPVRVEHVKARSRGELSDDFALVISDVEIDGDPRAGLRVQLHGVELVNEKREAKATAARKEQAKQDANRVRDAILKSPGIGTTALRGATHLSGDRVAAAVAELADEIEVRDERRNPTGPMSRCHYVRCHG